MKFQEIPCAATAMIFTVFNCMYMYREKRDAYLLGKGQNKWQKNSVEK